MALKRNAVFRGLTYRGGGPMLAWLLHRISGLGMIVFVGTHVLASYFQYQLATPIAQSFNVFYESVYFQIVIYFLVIFHTLNGSRIILMDVWPQSLEYQKEATWLQWLIFLPVYGLTVFIMLQRHFSGG
jgi:succinate dehydrogenase / fumarate reductase cytochrome b subunit